MKRRNAELEEKLKTQWQALEDAKNKKEQQRINWLIDAIPDERAQEVVRSVVEALCKNDPKITKLDLHDKGISDTGVKALAQVIEHNRQVSLEQLNLRMNRIGTKGALKLAQAIENNAQLRLKQLDLRENNIKFGGAQALARAIENNLELPLQLLDLGNNEIGSTGTTALARVLKNNQTLQQLNLQFNQISDSGATALAQAIEKNLKLSLHRLNLGFNKIGDTGAIALAQAIEKNPQLPLEELHLNGNNIDDAGAQALVKAIENSPQLPIHTLNLHMNQIHNKEVKTRLEPLLQTNKQITTIFRQSTAALQSFIRSHQNQTIKEEQAFLPFQKEIQQQHQALETLTLSLEKIVQESGKMSLNEGYRKTLENIFGNLHDLLLNAFEDKLALLSQAYFTEKSSEDRKIALGKSLYDAWVSFFGFQCPNWLKAKKQSLTTLCVLLSIAEGKDGEESLDPPEILFERISAFT